MVQLKEMKRAFVTIFLGMVLLTSSSCVDIDIRTRINPDESGVQTWKFRTTALLAGEIKKQVERDTLFQRKGVKISDEFKEGDYILTAEIPFGKVSELSGESHELRFEKSGFLKRTYSYTETWSRQVDTGSRLAWQGAGTFSRVTLQISVEMPGKISESNADQMEGAVAQWSIRMTDLVESRSLQAKSTQWNLLVLIPALVAGMMVVATIGFLVLTASSRKSTSSAGASCPGCGLSVPKGSAFCNSCGRKL
jgi:hypothetical protein